MAANKTADANKEQIQTPPVPPAIPDDNKDKEQLQTPPAIPDESNQENVTATEEPIIKSGFLKVQIKDFRGAYADAKFDDDGICERISEATLKQLAAQFPGADVISYEKVD